MDLHAVSPAPAGIGPLLTVVAVLVPGFPRARGDRPEGDPLGLIDQRFPPRPRG